MDSLIVTKVIAALLLPPGNIVVLLVLAVLLWRRSARASASLVIFATVALYLFSVSPIAARLTAPLERIAPLSADNARLGDRQAIVVLGGGRRSWAPEYGGETVSAASLERIRYGAWLQRRLDLPLAVTGGVVFGLGLPEAELMARVLIDDFRVPVRWIEANSRNTEQNALLTRRMLEGDGVTRIILVSHAAHLRRAQQMFSDQGFDVLLAPTGFATGPDSDVSLLDWIPSSGALRQSWFAMHEHLGRLWYWLRSHGD